MIPDYYGARVETFAFTFGRRLAINQLRNRGAVRSAQ